MTVRLIDDGCLWDAFVEESPYGLLYHKWDFLKIMEKYSGYELLPYGIYKGDELICLFPLFFQVKSGIRMLYSPPRQTLAYVPYLGFVMSQVYDDLRQHKKENYLDIVSRELNHEIGKLSPNHISIAAPPGFVDLRHFKWSGYHVDTGYTYIIDLQRSMEELWSSLSKDCRKSIRDCEKKRLTLKPSDDVGAFMDIMRRDLEQKGDTFFHRQSPEYLAELLARYPDNLKMSFLYDDDRLVAAAVNCEYKKHLLLWMCGKDCASGDYGEYLNWQFIRSAKEAGIRQVENWGTEQKLLCVYKSKFNPVIEPRYALIKDDNIARLANLTFSSIAKQPIIGSILSKTL